MKKSILTSKPQTLARESSAASVVAAEAAQPEPFGVVPIGQVPLKVGVVQLPPAVAADCR